MTYLDVVSVLVLVFVCRKLAPFRVDKIFRRLKLISSSSFSPGHGGNDAKSMVIIWPALIIQGHTTKDDPIELRIKLSCQTAIAPGTLSGVWRINVFCI